MFGRPLEWGLPGDARARRPVVVMPAHQRPWQCPAKRWQLPGHDSWRGSEVGVHVQVGDVIEQLDRRRDRLVAQAPVQREARVHAPVVLEIADETPAAEISAGSAETL